MKIFDTHTHVFPDKIAKGAIRHLREQSQGIPAYTDGTYDDHAAKCKEAGYTAWMNCPVVTRAGQALHTNQWAAEHNTWPSLSLGAVHPEDEDQEGILQQIQDLGLWGVKFHPEYQGFSLLEPRMEKLWATLENRQLKVLFHAGEDIGFRPPYHTNPKDFAELARRHPGLQFIAGHLGGWNQWNDVEEFLAGSAPNVYLETSFALPFMKDPSQMTRIIRKHGIDKVMFGTDSPWQDLSKALQDFLALDFTPEEQEQILWRNVQKFWNFQEK